MITLNFSGKLGKKFSSFVWIYLDNYTHVPLHCIHIPLLTRSVPTLGLSVGSHFNETPILVPQHRTAELLRFLYMSPYLGSPGT